MNEESDVPTPEQQIVAEHVLKNLARLHDHALAATDASGRWVLASNLAVNLAGAAAAASRTTPGHAPLWGIALFTAGLVAAICSGIIHWRNAAVQANVIGGLWNPATIVSYSAAFAHAASKHQDSEANNKALRRAKLSIRLAAASLMLFTAGVVASCWQLAG